MADYVHGATLRKPSLQQQLKAAHGHIRELNKQLKLALEHNKKTDEAHEKQCKKLNIQLETVMDELKQTQEVSLSHLQQAQAYEASNQALSEQIIAKADECNALREQVSECEQTIDEQEKYIIKLEKKLQKLAGDRP